MRMLYWLLEFFDGAGLYRELELELDKPMSARGLYPSDGVCALEFQIRVVRLRSGLQASLHVRFVFHY
jgi:hypothetical protein